MAREELVAPTAAKHAATNNNEQRTARNRDGVDMQFKFITLDVLGSQLSDTHWRFYQEAQLAVNKIVTLQKRLRTLRSSGEHARLACWRWRLRHRGLLLRASSKADREVSESSFRRDAETNTRDAYAPRSVVELADRFRELISHL